MHARGFIPITSDILREKYDGGGNTGGSLGYGSNRWSSSSQLTSSPALVGVSRSSTNLLDAKPEYTWTELEICGKIINISPTLWQFSQLRILHLRNNNLSVIPADVMRLTNLIVLDASSNKLHTLPPELGELFNLKDLILSHNCLRHLPYELGKLFQLQKLDLKGNPLPTNILSVLNENNGLQKLLGMLFDQVNVTAPQLPMRPWIPLNHGEPSRCASTFTVMCYNILCDKYCTRQLYGYCPPWALNWENRKKLILEEIRHYNADIVSLQEVETEQFQAYFRPELEKEGYRGVFSAKSRARTMAEADRKHVDGCAIFFKSSKFRAVKDHLIEFNQLAIEAADGSHDMINRVMTKDNIGLALLLETTDGVSAESAAPKTQTILVATCHVHWDPEFCDVKLIQTMMLMHRLHSIIKDHSSPVAATTGSNNCNRIPLILCGDLNSLPESGVVEYLTSGRVNANHKDFKDIGYECLCKLSLTSENKETYTHGFRLGQAYSRELLPFTNYTYDFKGIIDYIFYSRDSLRPLGVLGPLDAAWFEENRVLGCPHPQIPSDHLPLLAQFELVSSTQPIVSRSGTTASSRGLGTTASLTHSRR